METNLELDCCPADSKCDELGHASYDARHIGKLKNLAGKQNDFDSRYESGYKSVDDGFQSGMTCDSISEELCERDEKSAKSRVESEKQDIDKTNTIDSIDEGISSINLSTEILHCRQKSPTPTLEISDNEREIRERLCESAYQQDEDGDTHLHTSIIQLLESLSLHLIALANDPECLSIRNNYLQTALHLAVITKQPLLVRKLITAGAEVDVRDHWGNTPLHIACKDGESLIVRLILQPVTYEETKSNQYKITKRTSPQNLEARNYEGQVCLHLAAETGNCEILRDLISRGANINARDGKSGRTILHYAAESGNGQLVHFLLSQENIDVNSETYGGLTPIMLAKGRSHTNIVKMLRERGAYDFSDESSEEEMETESESISNDFAIDGKPVSCRN